MLFMISISYKQNNCKVNWENNTHSVNVLFRNAKLIM